MAETDTSPFVLKQMDDGSWKVFCCCGWNSKDLPFPDPDSALHCWHLHNALCKGPKKPPDTAGPIALGPAT